MTGTGGGCTGPGAGLDRELFVLRSAVLCLHRALVEHRRALAELSDGRAACLESAIVPSRCADVVYLAVESARRELEPNEPSAPGAVETVP